MENLQITFLEGKLNPLFRTLFSYISLAFIIKLITPPKSFPNKTKPQTEIAIYQLILLIIFNFMTFLITLTPINFSSFFCKFQALSIHIFIYMFPLLFFMFILTYRKIFNFSKLIWIILSILIWVISIVSAVYLIMFNQNQIHKLAPYGSSLQFCVANSLNYLIVHDIFSVVIYIFGTVLCVVKSHTKDKIAMELKLIGMLCVLYVILYEYDLILCFVDVVYGEEIIEFLVYKIFVVVKIIIFVVLVGMVLVYILTPSKNSEIKFKKGKLLLDV